MCEKLLDKWEQDFTAAALADDFAMFREHLEHLAEAYHLDWTLDSNQPQLMLQATIHIVRVCSAYAHLDGNAEGFVQFLNLQKYNFTEALDAKYAVTVDFYGKALGRILVSVDLHTLDLADLYGSRWPDFEMAGFHHLWISHPDWSVLAKEELLRLEDLITDDLRFDYGEDEVAFYFDESLGDDYLFVTVYDAFEPEDERDD